MKLVCKPFSMFDGLVDSYVRIATTMMEIVFGQGAAWSAAFVGGKHQSPLTPSSTRLEFHSETGF